MRHLGRRGSSRPTSCRPRRRRRRWCRRRYPRAGRRAASEGSMTSATTYLERLAARSAAVGTVLCLGVDPDPASLPDGFSRDIAGIERFALLILDACLPFAAAVKPNLAFFEAYGSAGWAALE